MFNLVAFIYNVLNIAQYFFKSIREVKIFYEGGELYAVDRGGKGLLVGFTVGVYCKV
jgi:hypothetical protein